MELTINIIIAAIMTLIVVALFLYFARKPLNIPVRFREMYSSKPKPHSPKFRNEAPIAPDMLFENDSHSQTALKHIPQYEAPKTKVNPTALQQEIAQILWYLRQVSAVYLDKTDMAIFAKGKRVAIVRCLEGKRIQIGHVESLIKRAKKLKVKAIYLVITGQVDRSAQKLIIRSNIKIIDEQKLDSLRLRVTTISKK